MIDLNERAKEVHAANEKWWRDLDTGEPLVRNKGELLMLAISEVAEAMEGERKNLNDDKIVARPMAEVEMADVVIRLLDYAGGFNITLPEITTGSFKPDANRGELLLMICGHIMDIYWVVTADESDPELGAVITVAIGAVEQYCIAFGYDLEGAYHAKMAYNATRADHKVEARKAAGGKRW